MADAMDDAFADDDDEVRTRPQQVPTALFPFRGVALLPSEHSKQPCLLSLWVMCLASPRAWRLLSPGVGSSARQQAWISAPTPHTHIH
jgi:hypothetical protein